MSREERIAEILGAWYERAGTDRPLDPADLIRAHPDLADELRLHFQMLDAVGGALGSEAGRRPVLPARIGRYAIREEIGSGGMGSVYRAEVVQPAAGEPAQVAIKVMHPHLFRTPGFFKRFLREAEVGRRVEHENVVRTLDADATEHEGRHIHYLVVEYVEGQTLRQLQQELGPVPESLCRHIGREIAKGLDAIHAVGVVHRDLKPENVLITEQYVVKVMDLGVARAADEALRLSQTGAFVGSVLYAAPERLDARDDDGRADLYALGLVLYELAAGRHPFAADEVGQVVRLHLEGEAVPLAQANPQVSPFFERVVSTLLQKDPDERFGSASGLLAVLEAGETGPWWRERARSRPAPTLRRVHLARETSLHGRAAEVERYRAAFERVVRGEGEVHLLEGEAGIGKTRLVDEVVGQLADEGHRIEFLFGGYTPGTTGTGAGAFAAAVREHFGDERLEEELARCLDASPDLVPPFAAVLRGDPRPDERSLSSGALATLFVRVIRAIVSVRPTVLLIDDLHFAPPEDRALFAALATAAHTLPLILVGAFRPGVPPAWLAHVQQATGATRHSLARLGPKDLVLLLEEALGSVRLAEELGGKIGLKSDGNPYFVFEILRDLRERELLVRQADGTWSTTQEIRDIAVPSSIVDLIEARLADLDREERELLEIAACAGFRFDPTLVAEVAHHPRIHALRMLGRLERRYQVVQAAGRAFVFDHHQVQEALYGSLSPPLREEIHGQIARAIEARNGGSRVAPEAVTGALAVDLCDHLQRAGEGARALRYLPRALEQLGATFRHSRAVEFLDRALDASGLLEGAARCRMLLAKAERLEPLGRRDEDRGAREEALELAAAGDVHSRLHAEALHQLGHHLERTNRNEEALATLTRAIDLAMSCGDGERAMRAHSCRGHVHRAVGRADEALADYTAHLELARRLGASRSAAQAVGNLGLVAWDQGDHETALRHHRESLEVAREIGDKQMEARAAGNLGLVSWSLGRFEEARTWHERDHRLSRETGDRWGEAAAGCNLGITLHRLGYFEEAVDHYTRSRLVAREVGDEEVVVVTTGNLGSAHRDLGRLARALEQLEAQRALAEKIGDAKSRVLAHVSLGRVILLLGHEAASREHLDRAETLSREAGLRGLDAEVRHARAQARYARGDVDGALDLAGRALDLHRTLGAAQEEGTSQLLVGLLRETRGELRAARDAYESARTLGARTGSPALRTSALARLATLPDGDADALREAIEAAGSRLPVETRMEACFRHWQATREPASLHAAHDLLDTLCRGAPSAHRDAVRTSMPLHREIESAWREEGQGGTG